VRKAHNLGRNHLQQVRDYYSKLGFDKAQSVLDSIAQDYQSAAVVQDPNPFAQGAGMPAFGGFGGTYQANYSNNFVARPGYTTMGGMTFGGPMPGMPLPPPPGMPLPGGQTAQAPTGIMLPPFGQFPPVGGIPSSIPPGPGNS
jgi:U1 small nuclear ribonucleoprotein C